MNHLSALLLPLLAAALCSCASAPRASFEAVPARDGMAWFKGNTHTHTLRSDGDSEPHEVAQWYKDHGYDFLFLTDHNVLTPIEDAKVGDESFLLIPGEEVTSTFRSPFADGKPVHINALDAATLVQPAAEAASVPAMIQANVDAIQATGAVAHINHPNFKWAITHQDLLAVENCTLLEICNGHPLVNNDGDATRPSMEVVWDILLTSGKRIHGLGTDDAHHFKGEFAPARSNPGRAWIVVRAPRLEKEAIMRGIADGNFYFSTGVELQDVIVDARRYEVRIGGDGPHRTEFIGRDGTLLLETEADPAVYEPKGTEMYVRAKIHAADGKVAWTQPAFVQ